MASHEEPIRWVGQQYRMEGYCGREHAAQPPQINGAPQATTPVSQGQPSPAVAASGGGGRERVVRIGPRQAKNRARPAGFSGPPDALAA